MIMTIDISNQLPGLLRLTVLPIAITTGDGLFGDIYRARVPGRSFLP